MGFFSWVTADTNKSISNVYSYKGALPVYLVVPESYGGEHIYESAYEGYGIFGGYDVFDLVVDFNRTNLSIDMLAKPDEEEAKYYHNLYKIQCEQIKEIMEGKSDEYMREKYGKEWKRLLGIGIACYDYQNESLEYPILFVEHLENLPYLDKNFSIACEDQGFFYSDEPEEDDFYEED